MKHTIKIAQKDALGIGPCTGISKMLCLKVHDGTCSDQPVKMMVAVVSKQQHKREVLF